MFRFRSSFSKYSFISVLLAILILHDGGCSPNKAQMESVNPEKPPLPLQSIETRSPTPTLDHQQLYGNDITKIDFTNFSYPVTEDLREVLSLPTFNVIRGTFSFEGGSKSTRVEINHQSTIYAHVTGKDSSRSAIIIFSVASGNYGIIGTGRSHCIYIYKSLNNKPELLWGFDTGDRADKGLRNIYSIDGNLAVETYNSDAGSCAWCAKTYTRSVYEWTEHRFKLIEAKKFTNPTGDAFPIFEEQKQR